MLMVTKSPGQMGSLRQYDVVKEDMLNVFILFN